MSDKTVKQPAADSTANNAAQLTPLAKRFLWADSPSAVNRVIVGLGCWCAVLFILDFIVHRHAYAPGEGLPGFYAIVGFIAFTLIVLGATALRRVILRNEQYYAPFAVDAEHYPEAGLETLNMGEQGDASIDSSSVVNRQGNAKSDSSRVARGTSLRDDARPDDTTDDTSGNGDSA